MLRDWAYPLFALLCVALFNMNLLDNCNKMFYKKVKDRHFGNAFL